MPTEVEKLLIRLEATQAKFEKQLAGASRSANRRANEIENRFEKLNRSVTKSLSGIGSRLSGPLLAALAPAALVGAVRSVTSEIADLAAEAKQAGVSFESFQELQYATGKAKIGVDALTDGLKEMQLRADEFILTGKGSGAEAFARLGLDAAALAEGLKQPDALFETIIDRLSQLDKSAQIRIADEIFGGTGGEQFVRLLDQGVESLRTGRKEARDLGMVLSQDIADKAIDIDQKFQQVAKTVGTKLKTAIVEAAAALSQFVEFFNGLMFDKLDRQITDLGKERLEVENRILALRDKQRNSTGIFAQLEARQLGGTIAQLEQRMADIAAEEKRLMGEQDKYRVPSPTPTTITVTGGGGRGLPPPASDKENAYDRTSRQIQERTQALNDEMAAMMTLNPLIDDYGYAQEKAAIQAELLAAAERAKIKITPDLREKIAALAETYARTSAGVEQLDEAHDKLRQSMEELRDTGRDVMKGFISDLVEGKSASEALANALQKVADKLLDMALNNLFSGLGGSVGGGLLGGAIIPGILHRGGIAGRDGYGHGRSVSPAVFAGAPRYHNGGIAGLRPGEVPAILQKGEPVLPKGTRLAAASVQEMAVDVVIRGVFVDDNGIVKAQITQSSQQARQGAVGDVKGNFSNWAQQARIYGKPA